mgnify:CR=1 FL=1
MADKTVSHAERENPYRKFSPQQRQELALEMLAEIEEREDQLGSLLLAIISYEGGRDQSSDQNVINLAQVAYDLVTDISQHRRLRDCISVVNGEMQ